MKVLVVHNRYRSAAPSGEDRVVDQERAALEEAGHEVRGFERKSDDIAGYSAPRKALVAGQVLWSRSAGQEVAAELDRFRPDVVHVHNLFPLLSPSVLAACRRAQIACVVTFHNFGQVCASGELYRNGAPCRDCASRRVPLPAIAHGCYRGSVLATLPRAAAFVAHRPLWRSIPSAYVFLSEAQRRELAPAQLPPSRSFVKPNLIPPAASPSSREGVVAYMGRLTEEKGMRILMTAWDSYLSTSRDAGLRLAIAGGGPMEPEIRQWADTRSSVDVLGLLDRRGCEQLVSKATAVVCPSQSPETFGLVVGEAMAAAVPPVATAHFSFRELITDGRDGLLFPAGDPEALARLLGRIDEDPAWAEGLGRSAYRTYLNRFEPSNNVAELERIYQFAIDHPRSAESEEQ